jgi:flavin-dependent thymidylate synthase
MNFLRSAAPKVQLVKAFSTPFDNAIATARTCYSSRLIYDEDVRKDEKAIALRDDIAKSTYQAGHHTTLQHAHFQFALDGISRHALWAFFHTHPFYNSEQVSQRYVEVKPDRVLIPELGDAAAQERYETSCNRQMAVYKELLSLLTPAATELYFSVYPGRKKNADDKRWISAIKKRCQEVARYVLPIGTHAHLYHTISGLTLHRYHRVAQSADCPFEQKLVIDEMVRQVNDWDPLFFRDIESVIPEERTLEDRISKTLKAADGREFVAHFDRELAGKVSKLVHATENALPIMGEALREVFSVGKDQISDEEACAWLLDPSKNPFLGESLNVSSLSKAMRALDLVHFTFKKRISHTADVQQQRHRTNPGARPLLHRQFVPGVADFITPMLFEHPLAAAAKSVYETEMKRNAEDIAFLVERGVKPEQWQYLLPNAFPVRYTDTASLRDHHHKWASRLCYNAQEEIWNASLDEVKQVAALYPSIGKWLLPPCGLRAHSKRSPVCPEGIRFCGTPVWRQTQEQYVRVL